MFSQGMSSELEIRKEGIEGFKKEKEP